MIRKNVVLLVLLPAFAVLHGLGVECLPSAQAQLPKFVTARSLANGGMQKFTIEKGNHFSFPRTLKARNRAERVSWQVEFGKDCNYNLRDEDQKDWNKLCGLFYNLFNTQDNTVMVGWRWNTKTRRMELNAYYHVDGSREYTKPLIDVALGEPFQVDMLVNYAKKTYTVKITRLKDGKRVKDVKSFYHNKDYSFEINTYFGGNRSAPQTVSVYKAYVD